MTTETNVGEQANWEQKISCRGKKKTIRNPFNIVRNSGALWKKLKKKKIDTKPNATNIDLQQKVKE